MANSQTATLRGAQLFVLFVFSILAASFFATTGMLAFEFHDQAWIDLASLYSHLFIFFPTLGIVALVALYTPASVFVDLYWKHIWLGRVRFIAGFLVLAIVSYVVAGALLASQTRSIWETAPRILLADEGEPKGCATAGTPCLRMPVLSALGNLRRIGRDRLGLDDFVRHCDVGGRDPLIEPARSEGALRFCFASTPLSNPPQLQSDAECCKAGTRFTATVRASYANPEMRSQTSRVHEALLPFKVFFLLIVLVIGILLAVHHRNVEKHYPKSLLQIEIGLFVGSICMLFFPLMSEAYLRSSEALSGSNGRGTFSAIMPLVSLLFLFWAVLIGLFFYRRRADDRIVSVARLGGLVAGNIGIIKYTLVIAIFEWALGVGASVIGIASLAGACFMAIVLTVWSLTAVGPSSDRA